MEDVEDKRRIPLKVLWTLGAGAAALLVLWLTGALDQEAGEPQLSGQEEGAETTAAKPGVVALRPQIHPLRPVIVKLEPRIEKDPNRSSGPDEE